jgi:uncharacterized protein YndB with AHSA1/START domain
MTNSLPVQKRAIIVDYELKTAPEKVWRALTEPEILGRWLMPNDIAPVVGHRFTFRTAPAPGFDGVVHCEILECQPYKRLVHTWVGGPIRTVVTWVLRSTFIGGTCLHFTQDGFEPDQEMTYDLLDKGWRHKAASLLEEVCADVQ